MKEIQGLTNERYGMNTRRWLRYCSGILAAAFLLYATLASAEQLTLRSVDFSSLPGDRLQLELHMSGPAPVPRIFHTANPARIALDFSGVGNALEKKVIPINVGVASSLHTIEASGRTRVVVNLLEMVPYDTRVDGNDVLITLQKQSGAGPQPAQLDRGDTARPRSSLSPAIQPPGSTGATTTRPRPSFTPSATASERAQAIAPQPSAFPRQSIQNIDFRRGKKGEGRVLISLSDPNTVVDMQEKGGKVIVYFMNTDLPPSMARTLDVLDFATPVQSVATVKEGDRVRMTIIPATGDYDYLSYQSDGQLTLEFRPLTRAQKIAQLKKKFNFTGKRLSLNFQDIEVRSVLQILADFTNLNIVASDTVGGHITLRLNDVPWDQAMDLILKSKGLGKRQTGNVVMVAPLAEINKIEKEEYEALAIKEKFEPLKSEIIQLNYAKAAEVQAVLMGVQDPAGAPPPDIGVPEYAGSYAPDLVSPPSDASNRASILSERGVVNIDPRTNILIVKDTARNLAAIRKLVQELDKPVRQVLIESRVVIANSNFTREIGVRFGAVKETSGFALRGTSTPARNLLVDLAAAAGEGAGGSLGLAIFKAGDYLLSLELSALQAEDKGEILSNPRIVTSDQETARIEQGVEIPFATVSQNGTQTQFKKAVLRLEATPHITPDDHVQMELFITNDVRGQETINGPTIDKRAIQTEVLVASGDTVVLGGIFEHERRRSVDSVPFFGELPGVGWMFRKQLKQDDKRELLIFITPKILKETLALGESM
jgi:type IV pilus assembly protein PilQ